jgi:hypothetical protein
MSGMDVSNRSPRIILEIQNEKPEMTSASAQYSDAAMATTASLPLCAPTALVPMPILATSHRSPTSTARSLRPMFATACREIGLPAKRVGALEIRDAR